MFTSWQKKMARIIPVALGTACIAAPFYPASADIQVPLPAVKPVALESSRIDVSISHENLPVPARKPVTETASATKIVYSGKAPVPKAKPMGQEGQPLSNADALLYKKIFALQSQANWKKADELIGLLSDYRLRGHVMYQRYMHPTAYTADFDELAGWANAYADYPNADKIYKLAMARMPAGYRGTIRKPVAARGVTGYLDALNEYDRSYVSAQSRTAEEKAAIKALTRAIASNISNGGPTAALAKLQSEPISQKMDAAEYDEQLAEIANSYMLAGNLPKARELANAAARRSGSVVPKAGWVAGLSAWRQGDYRNAGPLFAVAAKSRYSSAWMVSASSYWASRSYMRDGKIQEAQKWLKTAASHPRTFYGLIATRALGWDFDFNWDMPEYSQAHASALKNQKGAQRAMLLSQSGQYHLAEAELRRIPPKDRKMTQALMAYAGHVGLPSYAMRLAAAVRTPDGRLYDAALYPMSPWTPQSGYKVDRALIHALIRQESKFNPLAANRSGATGLMQLMPQTATYVSGRRDFRNLAGHHVLKDPQTNLDIGQRYVEDLLYQDSVGTELFSLVIAYNAGPGNLRRWKRELASMQADPLLFVESIPMRETRAFVERVMANYWIYRMRMGQPTPSLDAVVEGGWARYVSLDDKRHASAGSDNSYALASSN